MTAENIYNWDEKGFLIGFGHAVKRIMTREAYEKGRVKAAKQDGSREFISLLATICADGTRLPPALIYQGTSGDLQNTWVDELTEQDEAFFTSSKTGWSNNEFALNYLKQIFDRYTREKAGRGQRLLIIDGHQSHVNWEFLMTCDRLRILVCILPPHTTHRIQPLDVSLFQPLATAYSKNINTLMHNSEEYVHITKRLFWPLFRDAWNASFTRSNIESGWKKTSIWPFNPPIILDTIKRPVTPPSSNLSKEFKTPTMVKGLRRFQRSCYEDPSTVKLKKLIHANEILLAKASLAEHRAHSLLQALQIEKKKKTAWQTVKS